MIRTSKAPFAFPLPWNKDVVFTIRAGDVIERGDLEAALAEEGAAPVFDFQLQAAFADGLKHLLADAPDEAEQLIELVTAEAALEADEQLPADEAAALAEARDAVRKAWTPYKLLLAQAARRSELLPMLSFQRFVTAWAGEGLPVARKGIDGLLKIDMLSEFAPIVLLAVGKEAYRALYASGAEKNFAPPSQSDESQARIASDTPAKAGSSPRPKKAARGRSGQTTHSSRSRKGSSPSSTSGSTAAGTAQRA